MNHSPIAAAVERHRLVDIAQRTGIAINATTRTVTVRCPMPAHGHADRTPSMRLYLGDNRYYCFGCGVKGDIVQWVRDAEALSVAEAIKVLDSGRPIANAWAGSTRTIWNSLHPVGPPSSPDSREAISQAELPDLGRTPAERVLAALDAAWGYYTYRPLQTRGVAYLTERGVQIRLLESHTGRAEVGHTPARPDGLVTALRARGFTDDELVDAGLAYRRLGSNPLSDFYRHRVLIPIRDSHQGLCGFVGRNVGDARWPKYKNPPRTLAYDKSVNLYQPLPAPVDVHGQVVVVEGTLDALAIATAAVKAGKVGLFCPITQSGRELSDHQIRLIVNLHPAAPVLSFDSDPAGDDSALRYALSFAAYGNAVTVTSLERGQDPASWLSEHGSQGLSVWSRNNHTTWDGPAPLPAATFAARYINGLNRNRTERMEALVDIAHLATRLPGRPARLWAERVAAIAGPAAVAETHEHLVAAHKHEAPRLDQDVDLDDWHTKPAPEVDVGFEAAVGPAGVEAFIERVAIWGRRLPRPGDPVFIRSASVTLDAAGILPATPARARLYEALGRIDRSIDPAEAATPVLTTEAIGL
jgi:DNA primase